MKVRIARIAKRMHNKFRGLYWRQMFVTVVPYLRAMAPSVSPDLIRWYCMAAFSAASFLSCSSLAISSSKS